MKSDLAFKVGDAESYRDVTDLFDYYTQRFTAGIADYMYQLAGQPQNLLALDVGTGTGVIALAIAHHAGNEHRMVGIDLSRNMLIQARKKCRLDQPPGTVDFLAMDAENLAFPDNSFDLVFSLYALRHFPNPENAVAEMHRVLRPGGIIVVGIGSPPRLLSWEGMKAGFRKLFSLVRQATGRELNACQLIDELIEEYLPQSPHAETTEWVKGHQNFSQPLGQMVKEAGFIDISSKWAGQYSIIDSVEDFFLLQVTFSSLARKRLARADALVAEELRTEFNRRCEMVLERRGRLVYQSGATIVAANKAP